MIIMRTIGFEKRVTYHKGSVTDSPIDSGRKCRFTSEPDASKGSCSLLSSFPAGGTTVDGNVISLTPSLLPMGGTPEQNVVSNQ